MRPIKIFSAICLIGMAMFFVNACSKSDASGPGPVDPSAQAVTIQGMQFQPATVTVAEGIKITWTNMDGMDHTVTSNDGTSFNSGTISPGGTFTYTAVAAGSYPYHCSIHPTMTGTVQVVVK